MKKGAFSGLLYREWVLLKKSLVIALITSVSAVILSFLVVLSSRYGNLAMLDEGLKAKIFGDFGIAVKAFPALTVCFLVNVPADAAGFETKTVWEHFRRSTPVSGFRLALAKYTIMTAFTLVAAGGVVGVTALMCAALGTSLTASDITVSLVLLAVVVIMSVVMQVSATFFKSPDKSGLAALGAMLVCLLPIIAANRDIIAESSDMTVAERLNLLTDKLSGVLPFVPLVIAAVLALGLFATTLIYKRREK